MSGLGSVFKRGKERPAPSEVETPLQVQMDTSFQAVPPPKSVTRTRAKVGRRSQGYAQWNVLIPEDIKLEAQIRCKRDKRDMADLTEKLLAAWLKGELNV